MVAENDRLATEGEGIWFPQDCDGDPAPSSPNLWKPTYKDALLAGHGWQPSFAPSPG
ncbi:MAG: hypothetical protein Q8P18_01960 [Pseudomonadota bacterium]|nr:hypothetical protein [Pseudomonadota bacterium]